MRTEAHAEFVFQQNDFRLALRIERPDGSSAWLAALQFQHVDGYEAGPAIEPRSLPVPNKELLQAIVDAAAKVGIVAQDTSGELSATKAHLRDMKAVGEAFGQHLKHTLDIIAAKG